MNAALIPNCLVCDWSTLMMKRIAVITPMLQPYRISFYEKLSLKDPVYEWNIFHGVSVREDGRPNYKGETNFLNTGCSEYIFHIGPFKIVYNRGMYSGIRRFDPDLVILQGIAGNISTRMVTSWAKRKKKKIIIWTSGWEPGLAKGKLLDLKNRLVSRLFKKADLFLTYSTKADRYVESMGINPAIIQTCYNGIETDDLVARENEILQKSQEVIEKYQLKDHITFIYVGGLIPEKRVDMLLHAFRALRKKYTHIKLMIIGDGPLRNEIMHLISEMNDDHIYYLGRIIDDVDKYFAASDCLVLPGVGGLALNQAMFWRKTCIVSEADGTEDDLVIDGETGFRFEKNNLVSLTEAMDRRIRIDNRELFRMSDKVREIIDTKSNVNNMVHVFISGVRRVLEN